MKKKQSDKGFLSYIVFAFFNESTHEYLFYYKITPELTISLSKCVSPFFF